MWPSKVNHEKPSFRKGDINFRSMETFPRDKIKLSFITGNNDKMLNNTMTNKDPSSKTINIGPLMNLTNIFSTAEKTD